MEPSIPVVSDVWSYFTSSKFIKDIGEASNMVKNSVIEAVRRIYYTRCERRVAAAQRKERPGQRQECILSTSRYIAFH
ncbi:hypothetical protein KIN20_016683 [Parelaphostrongylus tenuis]|uniref:Uncharacterized protein n=1 Tax=Parelaphostrongylus tenuis TaxID=148309 RepID=A0AAD5QTB6_PARTN|nr:hypothetical protein KIN20_016683 [Parelaphostrongylus tenuis]